MSNKIPKEFEKLLVEWRATLGMSQVELANELRVSQVTISKWENGKSRASKTLEFSVLEWAYEKGLIDSSPRANWKEEE